MNSAIKSFGSFGLTFVVGLLSGAGLAILSTGRFQTQPHQEITVSTDIFSVLDEEVVSLIYSTDQLTLTAQRSKPADQFAVQITYADGQEPQQCLATPDLAGQLAGLSTISAKKQISMKQFETDYPKRLGTLAIKDRLVTEPAPPMQFRTNEDRSAVAVTYNGYAAEVSARIEIFAKLDSGCKALARP